MGERNDAERSLRAARERLNAVALELSRRASGQYVMAQAKEKTAELKARAAQGARERTEVMKGRILQSPWALGFIGGVAGTVAGRMIGKMKRGGSDRPHDEYTATHRMVAPPGYVGGYGSYGDYGYSADPYYGYGNYPQGGYDYQAGAAQGSAEEKTGHLRENMDRARQRLEHTVSSAREHLPSREDLRQSASAVKHSAADHPGLWALAAVAAGAVIGSMMPVSARERQALRPVKARAREKLEGLQAQARDRVESVTSEVKERIGLEEQAYGAGPDGRWREPGEQSGATYHASGAGGTFGPSYVPEVDRSGGEAGYGGGSVGITAPREGEETGYDASTGVGYGSSSKDEAKPFIAVTEEDQGATRH